jgi:hypothetical protein
MVEAMVVVEAVVFSIQRVDVAVWTSPKDGCLSIGEIQCTLIKTLKSISFTVNDAIDECCIY